MAALSLLPRGYVLVLTPEGGECDPLRGLGFATVTASDLDDNAASAEPDVVLLNGSTATAGMARRVRTHPGTRHSRLVMLVDRDSSIDADDLADTADAILERPVSPSVLKAVITRQLREREREATVEARHLQEVADSAPLSVWMLDAEGMCSFVNRSWMRFTGMAQFQAGMDPWQERVHPDDAESRLHTVRQAIEQRQPFQTEYRLRRHDGEYRTVVDRGLPRYTDRGAYAGYVGAFLDVTDQRQAQEVMRARAQFNRGTFEGSPESMTLIGMDGNVLMVNPAGLRALRLESQEEVAGQFWPALWPEHQRSEAEEALNRARRGRVARFRGFRATARGEPRWWDVVLSPMFERGRAPDQIVAIARDISDVKRAEAESQRLLNEQTALLESTGEGIYGVDLNGRCTFINSSALAALGYQQDEMLGQDMHRLLHGRDAEGLALPADSCLITRALREHQAFRTDSDIHWRKDGAWIPVEYSVHPIEVEGSIIGAVVAFRDITERRRAEAERERLLEAEQSARIAAEGAVSVRNAVLATVSHDLKNPITAIKGTAQLLTRMAQRLDAPEAAQIIEGLQHIDGTTSRMVSLINELVDVARLRAGQPLELRRRPVDMAELAQPIVESVQAATDQHTITLSLEGDGFSGYWDPERLERVVANLLSNAVKYSPDGGEIACRLVASGESVRFSVRDQGVGIPAADLPRIFQPFQRAANVREQFAGTGLGLAGARHIIAAHGGEIWAESIEHEGTTITFNLPLGAPDLDD